jgi:polyhydroxybutyrate depolymerase
MVALAAWLGHSAWAEQGLVFRSLETPFGQRRGWFFVPAERAALAPLVVVLHGAGSSAGQTQRLTGFSDWAREQGWLVCFPEALNGHWNDGRNDLFPPVGRQDDVACVRAWIELAAKDLGADPQKVFVCGYDSGGALALLCGVHLAPQLKGVAACMSSLALDQKGVLERSQRVTPMLLVQSGSDPCWPFQGGSVKYFGGRPRGQVMSSQALLQLWSRVQCGQPREVAQVTSPEEPRLEWWCLAGTSKVVGRMVLQGAGHIWPGTTLPISEELYGPRIANFSATALIGKFFLELP